MLLACDDDVWVMLLANAVMFVAVMFDLTRNMVFNKLADRIAVNFPTKKQTTLGIP